MNTCVYVAFDGDVCVCVCVRTIENYWRYMLSSSS